MFFARRDICEWKVSSSKEIRKSFLVLYKIGGEGVWQKKTLPAEQWASRKQWCRQLKGWWRWRHWLWVHRWENWKVRRRGTQRPRTREREPLATCSQCGWTTETDALEAVSPTWSRGAYCINRMQLPVFYICGGRKTTNTTTNPPINILGVANSLSFV